MLNDTYPLSLGLAQAARPRMVKSTSLSTGLKASGRRPSSPVVLGAEQALIWTFQLYLFLVLPHWSALAPHVDSCCWRAAGARRSGCRSSRSGTVGSSGGHGYAMMRVRRWGRCAGS
jgi:hypothetical protein